MPTMDIFEEDAFSVQSLTDAFNNMDHVPGRAGELAFAGVGRGVTTTSVMIEQQDSVLTLLQTSKRGGPSPQHEAEKRKLRSVAIPHIEYDDTIVADEVQNVRAFGSEGDVQAVEAIVNQRLEEMGANHDLTLENLRLGALRGTILDADGSTLLNLFTTFGVQQPGEIDFALGTGTTDVRGKCAEVIRNIKRSVKAPWPSMARVHAFCSDEFFDALLAHANVKGVYDGYAAAERRLGESYVHGVFEFGGIFFENYQGTDDNTTVAIAANKAIFFPVGVPGVFREYYAPADFMETVNTVGLPRYAKQAPDPSGLNRHRKLHTQQNPLPICLKPRVLQRAKKQ